jgi:ligand-binding sensor domain-containing protein
MRFELAERSETGLRRGSQDLYIGNILGGVPLNSIGKNPHEVGDITEGLPRVTSVWVDQTGVLYAFTDNGLYPYETIEEFKSGGTSPFFSLVLKRYGAIVAADSAQNVYAQGEDSQGQQVVDVYPPGSQNVANEYVVPSIGRVSGPQGLAFDSTGTLLVGVAALANNKQGQVGAVFRLDAGSATFVNLNLEKAYGGLIATDGAGNLYVGGGQLISVYAPGATSPSRIVHTQEPIVTLTAASDGTLYVDTYAGITVYSPGKRKSKNSFASQAQVSGLALGPG